MFSCYERPAERQPLRSHRPNRRCHCLNLTRGCVLPSVPQSSGKSVTSYHFGQLEATRVVYTVQARLLLWKSVLCCIYTGYHTEEASTSGSLNAKLGKPGATSGRCAGLAEYSGKMAKLESLTLRVNDWQSESDLDSIRNSFDIFSGFCLKKKQHSYFNKVCIKEMSYQGES